MSTPTNNAAEKMDRLESVIVESDKRITNIQHAVEQLLPTSTPTTTKEDEIYYSADPEVIAAKTFIAATDAASTSPPNSSWLFPVKKYNTAKRIVSLDLLSRCTFELDGLRYQLTNAALSIRGTKYTAPEMLKDTRILRHLVKTGSGVKQIF
jgi:hypothetical protein